MPKTQPKRPYDNAVTLNKRKRGIIRKAIEICQQYYPSQPIFIAAQTYLIHFYQALGFCIQGDCYLEDGIEHVNMILEGKHDA